MRPHRPQLFRRTRSSSIPSPNAYQVQCRLALSTPLCMNSHSLYPISPKTLRLYSPSYLPKSHILRRHTMFFSNSSNSNFFNPPTPSSMQSYVVFPPLPISIRVIGYSLSSEGKMCIFAVYLYAGRAIWRREVSYFLLTRECGETF